jgi:hypothetical protein
MATSNLLQKLDGETEFGGSTSNRRTIETFLAGAAIVAGDVVMWDTTQTGADKALYVKQSAPRALGQPLACGVALNAGAAGDRIKVVTSGYVAGVNCTVNTGTIVLGDPLVASVVTAGEVEVRVAADTARTFGVALEIADATTVNTVTMIVYPQF